MILVKKLIFAPLFLIVLTITLFQLNPLITSTQLLLSLNLDSLWAFVISAFLILLTSLLFVIFAALASDIKIVLPILLISAILPFMIFFPSLGIVLAVGISLSFLLGHLMLTNNLKSYTDFKPTNLFGPVINNIASLLILVISLGFYFSANLEIKDKGFEIPDSLIEATLNFSLPQTPKSGKTLDRSMLKTLVKSQLENIIKPYLDYLPIILALILLFTLKSLVSLLSFVIPPIILMIFYLMEKSGLVKFTSEMREVKKMVI